MTRMKGILTAGTLTGLLLVTALIFGFGNSNGDVASETAVPPEIIVNPIVMPEEPMENVQVKTTTSVQTAPTSPTGNSQTRGQAVSGDATYTQQLEEALQLMQSREAEYQTQIETANQTIIELQDQTNARIAAQVVNAVNPAPAGGSTYTEYEDDDHDEYEDHDDHDDDDDDHDDDDDDDHEEHDEDDD